jgi:hypothetical protein
MRHKDFLEQRANCGCVIGRGFGGQGSFGQSFKERAKMMHRHTGSRTRGMALAGKIKRKYS